MGLARKDRIKDQTTTTGTGAVTLAGTAPTGFLVFTGNVADGDIVRYLIETADHSEWEVGEGVYDDDADTLTRVTVFASSNSGSLVDFSAGTKSVSLVFSAKDMKNTRPWKELPTVTRVSNTQFTIADPGNVNLWDTILTRGMVLKWTDTTTHLAMVKSSAYDSNVVTVDILGDILEATATMTSFSYFMERAKEINLAIAGTMAVATDLAGTFYPKVGMKVFSADVFAKTAPTGAALTFDINDGGTTMFTTKPSIAATGTSDIDNTADDGDASFVAMNSPITVDVDAIGSTIPGIDAYIKLFVFEYPNIYLT